MKPILNLNKHPKDCENLSLVEAINVRLSNDGSCLQTEEAIVDIKTINDQLNSDYNNNFNIIDTISCNKELIIFVKNVLKPKPLADFTIYNTIDIYRYNEDLNIIKKVYSNLNYHNGRIKGAFTYNVHNELIIAFSEYDGDGDVPLRTINLGKFEDEVEQLPNELLPINPEVIIPTLRGYDYITGNLPKGWYYLFIRYKIDNVDYTKWFDFSNKILVDSLEQQSIFKLYGYRLKDTKANKFSSGVLDHFSSKDRFTNETLKLNIENLDNRYKTYQLAFICVNNTDIISYKTTDINISSTEYTIDIGSMEEYEYQELIKDNYNLYNAKTICNHQNRLYVANYKEKVLTDYDAFPIFLDWKYNSKVYTDVKDISYDISKDESDTYFSTEEEIDNSANSVITGTAKARIQKDLVVDGVTYNTLIDSDITDSNGNKFIYLSNRADVYTINCYDDNRKLKDGIELIPLGYKVTQNFKILTTENELITVYFYAEVTIKTSSNDDIIYFKYVINNKSYYAYGSKVLVDANSGIGQIQFTIYESTITDDILTEGVNTILSPYINTKNSFKDRRKTSTLIPGEIYNFYIHFVDKYGNTTKGFKLTPKQGSKFIIYTNNKGDSLFKVPNSYINAKKDVNGLYYSFSQYTLTVGRVTLPEGYIGYFISYEKFQETAKVTGLLTKYDFNDTDYENNSELKSYNLENATKMNFYSSDFDVLDSVNLNYNKIRIEKTNVFKASEKKDIFEDAIVKNINNLNVIESEEAITTTVKTYPIEDYKIKVASDVIKNRFGLGTVLELPIIDELFKDNEINIYKATLLYENDNIYTDLDKELIQCTNVIYPEKYDIMVQSLNGRYTYNSFIIYDNNTFIYNPGETKIYADNEKLYIDDTKTAKPLVYVQMPVYKDFFYETKSFKNEPVKINFKLSKDTEDLEYFNSELGLIVEPKNTIDLFENKLIGEEINYIKYYNNNRTDIKYLTQFDKIVRRSDVIQDESSSNAWRQFGLENYKVISENKGKITNIVGIGYYFIVHTEHSLFAFNNDNKLSALDKEIQLTTPDIFDIDYQEILTSNLGYGGLQNNDDWVLGTFGYIYYDKDSNRIFRFDNGKLDYIDNDIVQFLNKYKPKHIHFADDIKSNRLLLNIIINDINENYNFTLSYNYGINRFISIHNYKINKVANTKNNLYFVYPLYINKFDYNAVLRNEGYTTNDSTLSFIINERYQSIKYLEYIIYKLYNVKVNTDDYTSDNNLPPVEGLRKPYSGEQIRVYNDEVDTGWLDIHISKEESKNVFANYDKPYWEKGNWNFSYLRDKNTKSRLYGNYFVVSIKFKGLGERIEFESLLYSISKERL